MGNRLQINEEKCQDYNAGLVQIDNVCVYVKSYMYFWD